MKKLLILIPLVFLITSCSPPTQQEIDEQKKICDINWEELYINTSTNEPTCLSKMYKSSVMDCVREYRNGLDEKYNNPDTVSNLREDNYSQVVKTCNEVFGKSLSGSVNNQ